MLLVYNKNMLSWLIGVGVRVPRRVERGREQRPPAARPTQIWPSQLWAYTTHDSPEAVCAKYLVLYLPDD